MSAKTPTVLFSCGNETASFIGPEDMVDLQVLLERSADYFDLVEGRSPGPEAARDLLSDGPPGWSQDKKLLMGISDREGRLIAVLDGMRDYPEAGVYWIGLLLVDPVRRGQGLGERILAGFEDWSRSQGAWQVGLGVVEANSKALRFWRRMGFELVSKTGPAQSGQQARVIFHMRKSLSK